MKFCITFKDPDRVGDSIEEMANEQVSAIPNIDEEEREALLESRKKKIDGLLEKWIEYGEYVEIEFDTDAGTATVVPQKE